MVPKAILCAPLIRKVDLLLLDLLESLPAEAWDFQTIAPQWRVRDVAAHLLDTALRKLSMARDGWFAEQVSISSAAELAALVNRMNQQGVAQYRRLSPAVLISLLRAACAESASFHESLDPFAPAAFAVSWAGEQQSANWMDTARELTERWHHQQQIRLACGREGILTRELYCPVLDCFLRVLPYGYRNVEAANGAVLQVEVQGDCGGSWRIQKGDAGWSWAGDGPAAATVTIPQQIAWRVFTRGIPAEHAIAQSRLEGDAELARQVFQLTAIVAS